MERSMIAHDQTGTSDKLYVVSARSSAFGGYDVVGKWGRRGNTLSEQKKGTCSNLERAQDKMRELFGKKIKKGYVNIESVAYHGPVTLASVKEYLEGEEIPDVPDSIARAANKTETLSISNIEITDPKPVVNVREVEVQCVDNLGMENRFDLGECYLGFDNGSDTEIDVLDNNGVQATFFRERFEVLGDA